MTESKLLARLRAIRETLGRTGESDESETESGFTLIELMVVLLIMGILLAIAIPTFLSVTGGAKRTATQSDLTDASTSAIAIYTNGSASFPKVTATTTLGTKLHATQTGISFTATLVTAADAGKNVISFVQPTTSQSAVVLSAVDGNNVCWVVGVNETNNTIGGVPAGTNFYGHQLTAGKTATCSAATILTTATIAWTAQFPTTTVANTTKPLT